MKSLDFPIFKTKIEGLTERFNLEDPAERHRYFRAKAGAEIENIQTFLENNTFVAFLLGKKNSGKGTYTKLFIEAVGSERVAHISIGDIIRRVHRDLSDEKGKRSLSDFLSKRYRGFIDLPKIFDIILGRDTKSLLPTEVILALVEREIDGLSRRAIFIDGFPRNLDQVSYSLYFRALIGYRHDPDFFVFIDLPEAIIDERMKNRVVCPKCQTPRNLKLLRTKYIGFDRREGRFYLKCDNPSCDGTRMISKEGDSLGIEAIRERLEIDDKVMETLLKLKGVPKIYLRNSIPTDQASRFVDDYEITPAYDYKFKPGTGEIIVRESPWTVKDDGGNPAYSLLPAAVVVSLIRQVSRVLGL